MRRLQFVMFVTVALVSSFAAPTQSRAATIGVLAAGDPGLLLRELSEELRRRGYVEGQNLRFEIRLQATWTCCGRSQTSWCG